jgi:WD40 repeat protein
MFFSPDNLFVAGHGADEDTVEVWKLGTRRSVWKSLHGPQGYVASIGFTHDSSELAAQDSAGNCFAWSLDTGELVSQFQHIDIHDPENFHHFVDRRSHKSDTIYALSGLIPADREGWVCTRDNRRLLWIPFDYRGKMRTNGRTAAIKTRDGRLVVIRMGDDD